MATRVAQSEAAKPDGSTATKDRAFRGLFASLLLSFVNFVGLLLTATSLGVLKGWSTWEFAALFGTIEAGIGLASLYMPNIWHMPVAELETDNRTRVKLAVSSILLPHWGGGARFFAGVALVIAAAYNQGAEPSALLIAPVMLLLAMAALALSLLAARYGVSHPDVDVVQFSVRWRGKDQQLKPLSISASILQFFLGITTLPAAEILHPSILFSDDTLRLEPTTLLLVLLATGLIVAVTLAAWFGRITWQAPRAQQKEIEANA